MNWLSSSRRVLLACVLVCSVLLLSSTVSPVKAQSSGLVCLAASGTTTCPPSPPTFTTPPGQTLAIAVNVQNSPSFNGFDIAVKADPTIINGTSIDTTGDIFLNNGGQLFIVAECINGHPVSGNCTSQDGLGVAHIAAASNIMVTGGHLFNINYAVKGVGNIPIGYQTGCTGTSNDGFCVTIASAGTLVPESLQGAIFNNSSPDFTISASPLSQILRKGSSTTFTITVTGLNGFNANVNLQATISPVVARGPTASLPSSVGPNSTSTMTVSAQHNTPTGTYTITVTGTSGSLSHSVSVTVTVTK
jgi:hypothetical protein